MYDPDNVRNRPSCFCLYMLLALSLGVFPCWAEVKIEVREVPLKEGESLTLFVESQLDEKIHFSCSGKGFLKAGSLRPSASKTYRISRPGIYQYKITVDGQSHKGVLPIEIGKRTEVTLTGTLPRVSLEEPSIPQGGFDFQPAKDGSIRIKNPFGPAFEQLTAAEKIRLVETSPKADELSPEERTQLLGFLYNEKGVLEAERKKFSEAEASLRNARSYLPDEAMIKTNLAFAIASTGNEERQEGNLRDAEANFQEALKLSGQSGDSNLSGQIQVGLASVYVEKGLALPKKQTRQRATQFEKALSLDPQQAMALFQLGNQAYDNYQLATALQYYDRAYEVSPQEGLAQHIAKIRIELEEAGDFKTQEARGFTISFEGHTVKAVERATRKLLAAAKREVGKKLNLRPEGSIPVVIYSGGQFQQILGLHSWAGGAYDGKIRLPIADLSDQDLRDEKKQLEQLVFHEYTHALLHDRAGAVDIPIWFHEGLAQNAADQHLRDAAMRMQVVQNLESGRLPIPSRLRGDFVSISDPNLARQLYAESYLFVRYLIKAHGGWSKVRRFVDNLADGYPFTDAFEKAYRKPLEEIEGSWLHDLARRAPSAF